MSEVVIKESKSILDRSLSVLSRSSPRSAFTILPAVVSGIANDGVAFSSESW